MCASGDVVVVTVNHRLNILGYLNLQPFSDKYEHSANVGNLDLIAALKWVNRNIESFGGDKDQVTIFGQSGGGRESDFRDEYAGFCRIVLPCDDHERHNGKTSERRRQGYDSECQKNA